MSYKGKEREQDSSPYRLGTPLPQRERSSAPSPSPLASRATSYALDTSRGSSPFKRGASGLPPPSSPFASNVITNSSAPPTPTTVQPSNASTPTLTDAAFAAGGANGAGSGGAGAVAVKRAQLARIRADPSIASAFSPTDDRELYQLFLG